ncbi:MAG TPA: DNA polymerase Y family protein [Anaeromyxobacteraceae bacterium]|nr:DNA polymerase Y family protein [Anaeromyxobacteraceae bacterium]
MQLELSAIGAGEARARQVEREAAPRRAASPRRVLAIQVPDVSLQRIQRARRAAAETVAAERRDGRERPVAIAREGRIVACEPLARSMGVRCGDSTVQATASCAQLEVILQDDVADRALLVGLAEALMSLSPVVELALPDTLLVDASAAAVVTNRAGTEGEALLARRAVDVAADMGLHARVAVATGRGPARALARHGAGDRPIPSAETRAALAKLPLAALELPAAMAERIAGLGLRDVGALAALPAETLAHRFGPAGLAAARLASGDDPSPLVPYVPEALPLEELDLEAPVETAEPLLFGLKRVCDRLAARLAGRGVGTCRLVLRLRLDPRGEVEVPVALASPSASTSRWMLVLRERLATVRLDAPVRGVVLTVGEVAAASAEQLALDESPQQLAAVDAILARLAARLGDGSGFVAEPVDRHRPEAAYRAVAFRARRPSRSAAPVAGVAGAVTVAGAAPVEDAAPVAGAAPVEGAATAPSASYRPTRLLSRPRPLIAEGEGGRLTALRLDGHAHRILDLSPPERLSGEWWANPYDREYRRVEVETLGSCWVYRDASDGRFWLHGFFD